MFDKPTTLGLDNERNENMRQLSSEASERSEDKAASEERQGNIAAMVEAYKNDRFTTMGKYLGQERRAPLESAPTSLLGQEIEFKPTKESKDYVTTLNIDGRATMREADGRVPELMGKIVKPLSSKAVKVADRWTDKLPVIKQFKKLTKKGIALVQKFNHYLTDAEQVKDHALALEQKGTSLQSQAEQLAKLRAEAAESMAARGVEKERLAKLHEKLALAIQSHQGSLDRNELRAALQLASQPEAFTDKQTEVVLQVLLKIEKYLNQDPAASDASSKFASVFQEFKEVYLSPTQLLSKEEMAAEKERKAQAAAKVEKQAEAVRRKKVIEFEKNVAALFKQYPPVSSREKNKQIVTQLELGEFVPKNPDQIERLLGLSQDKAGASPAVSPEVVKKFKKLIRDSKKIYENKKAA